MSTSATRAAADAIIPLSAYRVIVAPGAIARIRSIVDEAAPSHRVAIITDDHVGPLYADVVRDAMGHARTRVLTIHAGESEKTRQTWSSLTDTLLTEGFGRDTTIIALGGGVVGDVAGFVAATYMRGVPVVQVPTSLLAMIDASIGGKTGVDTPAGKNLVGAFHQPAVVVTDPQLLRTLPIAHLRAGLAEAIKHGVVASERYFDSILGHAEAIIAGRADAQVLLDAVAGSVAIKADVVGRDEHEAGIRKTLNFGHTVGHAIESCSGYALLHGEAIAIGMVIESTIAERLGIAQAGTTARIVTAIVRAGLPTTIPDGLSGNEILRASRADKKARGGSVEYALPTRVGAMAGDATGWAIAVPDEVVLDALGPTIRPTTAGTETNRSS